MPAPTLLTLLVIAPGVGAVSASGQTPTFDVVIAAPSKGTVTIDGPFPTVIIAAGPYSAPNYSALALDPKIPTLLKTLVISPSLSDTVPDQNDLAPTVIWGGGTAPTTGLATVSGHGPLLIRNGGEVLATPPALDPPVVLQGQPPTVSIPAGETRTKEPYRAFIQTIEQAPSLLTELKQGPDQTTLTVSGLRPTVSFRYGWTTVALSGDAVWTDTVTI